MLLDSTACIYDCRVQIAEVTIDPRIECCNLIVARLVKISSLKMRLKYDSFRVHRLQGFAARTEPDHTGIESADVSTRGLQCHRRIEAKCSDEESVQRA